MESISTTQNGQQGTWDGESLIIGHFNDNGYPVVLDDEETKLKLAELAARDEAGERYRTADELDDEGTRVHEMNTLYRARNGLYSTN